MGLNDIHLPEFILSEWYGDRILVLPAHSNDGDFAAIKTDSTAAIPTTPAAPAITPPPTTLAAPLTGTPSVSPQTSAPTTATPTSPHPPQTPAPFKYLGGNRRHVTLLVNSPGSPFLPDTQLAFLTKILEACRMTIADVAIVNYAATPLTITDIKKHLQQKTLLLFGVDPTAILLPINFPVFRQMEYDSCTYLSAPGLNQLVPNTEESKLLKSKLWICLKTIFNV